MRYFRFYCKNTQKKIDQFYQSLDFLIENEGYSLSQVEIDEHKDLFELSLYVPENHTDIVQNQIRQISFLSEQEFFVEKLPDIDWVQHSLSNLSPIRVNGFFVHGSHDKHLIQPEDIAIHIEAGLAFGTGHHETTFCCLELLAQYANLSKPDRVLDLGTGSGILAIALAKLNVSNILATDIDPIAVNVATENSLLNRVSNHIKTVVSDGFENSFVKKNAPYTLIVANILASPLIEMSRNIYDHLSWDGRAILSGVLKSQEDRVLSCYVKLGLRHVQTIYHGDWIAIDLKKERGINE